jgi:flagellar biosynthesis protein FlhG
MTDQASELRKLVLRAIRESQPSPGPPPRLILITGGQSGVGVTAVAVNLAVALADQGARIVLIDADAREPGVARLCGLDAQRTIADVLVARRDIHEAMQLGPAGLQVIPGLWRPGHEPEVSSMALERLLLQITKLGRHADSVLVDVGNGANDLVRRFSLAADDVIVVTTTDVASIMDAYARIKLTLSGQTPATISLLVNRAGSEQQAADVFQRIDLSCRRFLGHGIELLGALPEDEEVVVATQAQSPVVLFRPLAPFTRAVQHIAARLATRQQPGNRSRATA